MFFLQQQQQQISNQQILATPRLSSSSARNKYKTKSEFLVNYNTKQIEKPISHALTATTKVKK